MFFRRACVLRDFASPLNNTLRQESLDGTTPNEFEMDHSLPNGEERNSMIGGDEQNLLANMENGILQPNGELGKLLTGDGSTNADARSVEKSSFEDQGWFSVARSKMKFHDFGIRKALLSSKTIRRILNFKKSILKYGGFVPRNENEANASPEHLRWSSGHQLEWMRLQDQGTFERNWDWIRVQKSFPHTVNMTLVMSSLFTIINSPGNTVFAWCSTGLARTRKLMERRMHRRLEVNLQDSSTYLLLKKGG